MTYTPRRSQPPVSEKDRAAAERLLGQTTWSEWQRGEMIGLRRRSISDPDLHWRLSQALDKINAQAEQQRQAVQAGLDGRLFR